ncbi:MAG: FkbM family methyltransferase [Verrucomicrobia bacterium]|nr:MAG: FkbM family methyltransferase [Verrucomicrobiota bacterium]
MRLVLHSQSHAALMSMLSLLRSIGNKIYQHAFPIYRPLYAAYKAGADRVERQLLRKVLFPGAIVVDAGANIGIYSQFLSRCVGPTGSVHAFEPSPDNFKRLRAATRALPNVHALQSAIGERSGDSELYLSDTLNIDHRTYAANGNARRTVPIQMVALDDYFKPGHRVDLIKMDIQGYELHALRGASRVVADNPGIKLLLEFWPYGLRHAGAHWDVLIADLEERGMMIRQVCAEGLIQLRRDSVDENPDWYVNLFASQDFDAAEHRLASGEKYHC